MSFLKSANVSKVLGENQYELSNGAVVDLTRALSCGETGNLTAKLAQGDSISYRHSLMGGVRIKDAIITLNYKVDYAAKVIHADHLMVKNETGGKDSSRESLLRSTFTLPEQIKLLGIRKDIFTKAYYWSQHAAKAWQKGEMDDHERLMAARRQIAFYVNTK
ncbi:MAG: hypothetical protein LBG89_02960 [Rickettsiales bacterium]|jgi:hypothetical protein|nr:hypothetical protein [Rickettsiales bacterium]